MAPSTITAVRRTAATVARRESAAAVARAERDAAIRAAAADGHSLREIAEAAGVHFTRVRKIVAAEG